MRQVPASLPRRAPPARRLRRSRVPPPGARGTKESEGKFLKQTTNYQLNQWDPEDRILRTDFNSDNSKIDAALKDQLNLLAKTCQPYIISYTGDGNPTRTMEFPGKPLFVIAVGSSVIFTAIRGGEKAYSVFSGMAQGSYLTTWGERSFTWQIGTQLAYSANNTGAAYQMFALLSME